MTIHHPIEATGCGDVDDALRRGALYVRYQPIVELALGETIGAEALVRCARAEGEEVLPTPFVEAAEARGDIGALGRFVLEEACEQAQRWIRDGAVGERFRMNVNVSSHQFDDGTLVDVVRDALGGLPGSRLVVELTECAFFADRALVIEQLDALIALGVRAALDDFGTGYSSLDLVSSLPVNTLKIDRSFVAQLLTDRRSRSVVRAIVHLGRALRMEVVAEGVESAAQRRGLRQVGCRLGQGYLFSPPLLPVEWALR